MMVTVGFHASHEQISPAQLLQDVQHAEQAGFDAAMCSDHIEPWSAQQGHSGFAWSWLGAALATTSLRFGVVTAPGQRYHPAIIAHASATLAGMFPGRFWMAPGSGGAVHRCLRCRCPAATEDQDGGPGMREVETADPRRKGRSPGLLQGAQPGGLDEPFRFLQDTGRRRGGCGDAAAP